MYPWLPLAFLQLLLSQSHYCLGGSKPPFPRGLNVTANWEAQILSVTWTDEPTLPRTTPDLTYEVQILHEEQNETVFHEFIKRQPTNLTRSYHLNWTSFYPLECFSNVVRVRSLLQEVASNWSTYTVMSEKDSNGMLYPKEVVVHAERSVGFCCQLKEDEVLQQIICKGQPISTTQISKQTYTAIAPPSDHTYNVVCISGVDETFQTAKGTTVFPGYPPGDVDLVCETDLKSVICRWNVGRPSNLPHLYDTTYKLNGSVCPFVTLNQPECRSPKAFVHGKSTWILEAENKLGKKQLVDSADLSHRVCLQPPDRLEVKSVHSRNATARWYWNLLKYSTLPMVCEVRLNNGIHSKLQKFIGQGLSQVLLEHLLPDTDYTLDVHCGPEHHFWKWSKWSKVVKFRTKEEQPDALDIWLWKESENQALVMWKPLSHSQSHGRILKYEVALGEASPPTEVNRDVTSLPLAGISYPLTVKVTAFNWAGPSVPSNLTIMRHHIDKEIPLHRIEAWNGGFNLSWDKSANASCGYVVEYFPPYSGSIKPVEWIKVPPQHTSQRVYSESFIAGVKYYFFIYACHSGRPSLIARREGYVMELAPLQPVPRLVATEMNGKSVTLQWTDIPPESQRGFIRGYKVLCNLAPQEPVYLNNTARSYTFKNLHEGTYNFTVHSYTGGGYDKGTIVSVKIKINEDELLMTAVCVVFGITFLSLILIILCYRRRSWVYKHLYSKVPKPKVTDIVKKPEFLEHQVLVISPSHYNMIQVVGKPKLGLTRLEDTISLEKPELPIKRNKVDTRLSPASSGHTTPGTLKYNNEFFHKDKDVIYSKVQVSPTCVMTSYQCIPSQALSGGKGLDSYLSQDDQVFALLECSDAYISSPMSISSMHPLLSESRPSSPGFLHPWNHTISNPTYSPEPTAYQQHNTTC